METLTIPRLTLLAALSAVLAVLLWLISRIYFSDILPLADSTVNPGPWRFQGAYFLTVLTFISAAVAFMSVLGLIALIGSRYLPRGPHNLS